MFLMRNSVKNVVIQLCCQAEGESEVLVAGDPERRHLEKIKQLGGIPYHPSFIAALVSCGICDPLLLPLVVFGSVKIMF